MAKKSGITVTLRTQFNRIPDLSRAMQDRALEEVARAAQEMSDIARQIAPVRTGYLRDHISPDFTTKFEPQVRSEAPYARYVEYGQNGRRAKPHMRPARDAVRPEFVRRMKAIATADGL